MVPRDVPAGMYSGTVSVTGQDLQQSLKVELQVPDVTLSDDFTCEVELNNYVTIGKKGSDLRLKYHQMAHRHRMAIHVVGTHLHRRIEGHLAGSTQQRRQRTGAQSGRPTRLPSQTRYRGARHQHPASA